MSQLAHILAALPAELKPQLTREDLANAVATRVFFCNVDGDEEAYLAYNKLSAIANRDVDADPSDCGYPAWHPFEDRGAAEVLTLIDNTAADILQTLEPKYLPMHCKLFHGSTGFMVCEVSEGDEGVIRLYELGNERPLAEACYFTLYRAEPEGLWFACLDGSRDAVMGQARSLRGEGADVTFVNNDGQEHQL